MKRQKLIIYLGLIIILRIESGLCLAPEEDIKIQEQKIISIEIQLDSLRIQHTTLMSQSEILVHEIDLHHSKYLLSPGEHRTLGKKLRESQILSAQVQKIEADITDLMKTHQKELHIVLRFYQKEIDYLSYKIDQEESQKKQDLQRLEQLLRGKQAWEARLSFPQHPIQSEFTVRIQPWDTPADLQMKGHFLMDHAEALTYEIRTIEERINALKKEEKVRSKLVELTREMDLFNEREELMGRHIGTQESQAEVFTDWNAVNNNRTGDMSLDVTEKTTMANKIPDLSGPNSRSISSIQEWIQYMEKYKTRMNIQADSLKIRAQWFIKQAEKKQEN